jgi:SAM-dependent methyltransferase
MEEDIEFRVENSAPSQTRSAKSVRWAAPLLEEKGVSSVCDYGCGRLRNLSIYRQHFDEITLVDTELQCSRIRPDAPDDEDITLSDSESFESTGTKFDAVFLVCVLHVIPHREERVRLLEEAQSHIEEGGFLLIDVPQGESYYLEKDKPENRYRDGILLSSGRYNTFYKNYHSEELDSLIKESTDIKFKFKKGISSHLVRVWEK